MKFLKKITKSEILFRVFDFFISAFLILIFSPIILLISFCIKVNDWKSPIFAENHMRVGKGGKLFFMYKFRTMIPHAHELLHSDPRFSRLKEKYEANGAKLKIKDDVRLTSVGKIIRRFDLDELPQLFNVLKGDMSMVGWRAYFKQEIDSYSRQHSDFRRKIKSVFKTKPGVTGLWQISGRNLLSVSQRISCDYEYYKKKSILFYILILLKTPYIVITRYGAYD